MIRREFFIVLSCISIILVATYFEWPPIKDIMDWKAKVNAGGNQVVSPSSYEIIDRTNGGKPFITVDFVKGKNFWHPQLAIWLEDSIGNYLETLVVTRSMARGLFYAGRSRDNFQDFDHLKEPDDKPTRRVDALPVWSHKRGFKYADGFYSPPTNQPLPDGITMATPAGNFYFATSTAIKSTAFKVLIEINVAFDENEYFSEYDYVEDSLYHGGTGLLGQPSIVYGTTVRPDDKENYYVLHEIGRGHHSGRDGSITLDLRSLTTARSIVERLIVGVNKDWYKQ